MRALSVACGGTDVEPFEIERDDENVEVDVGRRGEDGAPRARERRALEALPLPFMIA